MSPEAAKQLLKQGFKVVVEAGAGEGAKFLDADYIAAGAEVKSVKEAFSSDIVFKVRKENLLVQVGNIFPLVASKGPFKGFRFCPTII